MESNGEVSFFNLFQHTRLIRAKRSEPMSRCCVKLTLTADRSSAQIGDVVKYEWRWRLFSYIDVLTRRDLRAQKPGVWSKLVVNCKCDQIFGNTEKDKLFRQSIFLKCWSDYRSPWTHTHARPRTHSFNLYRWSSDLIFLWSGGRHPLLSCNIVAGRSWFGSIREHIHDVGSASWHQPRRWGDRIDASHKTHH